MENPVEFDINYCWGCILPRVCYLQEYKDKN